MLFRLRRPRKPEDRFNERWVTWWERSGRRGVIRLLADHHCPAGPQFNGPHWPEAEAIGDMARFGGVDIEELAEYLSACAEDLAAAQDPQRDAAAARAIVQYLEAETPTRGQ